MNDIIEFHIIPKLDGKTLLSFAMTSRECMESCKPEIRRRRLKRREEVLRCARIYKHLPVPEEDFPNNIGFFFPGCSPDEAWLIHKVRWDCWFRLGPDPSYEHHDPQLWHWLVDDMQMGAPHDAPLIYNLYMKSIKGTVIV